MGGLLKFGVFLAILIISGFSALLLVAFAAVLASYLGLNPAASTFYAHIAGDLLDALSVVVVMVFFTFPAVLAMFGHGGAWLKRVLAKSAKGLSVAFGASVLAYIGSLAASRVQFAPGLPSAIEPISVLVVIGIVSVGLISRGIPLRVAESIAGAVLRLSPWLSRFSGESENAAAIELRLTSTRQVRGKSEESVVQEEAIRFQRLARSLASSKHTTEFKMSFRGRRGRVLFLARGRAGVSELERTLLSVARTYLPEARPMPAGPSAELLPHGSSILLSGAPEAVPNPLEPLARFFLENGFEGDYAAVFRHGAGNPVSKVIARREQRRLAKEAGEQKGTESLTGEQTTKSVQDHLAQIELEDAVKKVERRASPQSIEAWVYVTGRGKTPEEASKVAESAAEFVRASLSSHRQKEEMKLHRSRHPFADLHPRGKASVMLPSEAAPLVWVPQMAIGIEVAPTVEFELPPPLAGEIELGEVVLQSGPSGHVAKLPLDDFSKHVFLTGMTGMGKTTSAFNLLLQLHSHGVPFLVIEPVKTEYRSLATTIHGLQVFTPGNEETAPFRLNIFEPPSGVSVAAHLEALEAAWNSSFAMYAPLPYVIKHVLVETYRGCGWDVKNNMRGRPITLDDFRLTAERVARKLGYEPNVTMNIEAALRTRITSLALGGKGALFNTTASIPMETILRRPAVIELKGIPNSEEKAFVAALLLSNLAEYLEAKGTSKSLRHLTLIEEAHRLLPNISTAKGDPEAADPRKTMVEQFANMLAEVRAYGEGLAIVEQIPTKILPDAIKNTATKVAHRVPAADDREVLAGAMGMTEEQSQVLTALKPGEAVVHLQGHPLPIRIVAPNRAEELGISIGETGDGDVKRLMAEFYLKNPLPREPASKARDELQGIVDSEWFRAKFIEGYHEMLRTRSPDAILELVTRAALSLSKDENEHATKTLRLLQLATEFHLPFDEEDRERFPREMMAYMARAGKGARRG